jgi:hypothetical protein
MRQHITVYTSVASVSLWPLLGMAGREAVERTFNGETMARGIAGVCRQALSRRDG